MSRCRPGSRLHAALDRRRWEKIRLQVLDRDSWRCRQCGKAGALEVDHIVPLRRGGAPYDMGNLQSLCAFPCHAEKTRGENERPDPARDAWRKLVAELL